MAKGNSRRISKVAPCLHTRARLIAAHKGPTPAGETGDPKVVCAVCLDCGGVARMLPPVSRAWPGDPPWVSNGSLAANLDGAELGPLGWRYDLLALGCGEDPLTVHGPADWARMITVGKAMAVLEEETWLQRIDAHGRAFVEHGLPTAAQKMPRPSARICGA